MRSTFQCLDDSRFPALRLVRPGLSRGRRLVHLGSGYTCSKSCLSMAALHKQPTVATFPFTISTPAVTASARRVETESNGPPAATPRIRRNLRPYRPAIGERARRPRSARLCCGVAEGARTTFRSVQNRVRRRHFVCRCTIRAKPHRHLVRPHALLGSKLNRGHVVHAVAYLLAASCVLAHLMLSALIRRITSKPIG